MNIVLSDDLQQLLEKSVASGAFPDEEAVVKEALRQFLMGGTRNQTQKAQGVEFGRERLPSPFLEDEAVVAPFDLPRTGRGIARDTIRVAERNPDCDSGE